MIELTLRVANSIGDVAAEAWDACANPAWPDRGNGAGGPCPGPANLQSPALGDRYNPFIAHDFLSALEVSQSVRGRTGWQPKHLLPEDATGASRKRKTIRRERADALAAGISVHWLTGTDLTESVWDAFFDFYMETGSRKWGRPYLTREFYSLVGEKMRERILLVMAKRNRRFIAGAINFIGSDTLFGRHWGAIEHHPFLHFELCYYQAIQYAIEHKLARVEAGAQGEHKISRGYVPTTTYSAHYIVDPALRRAIEDFLKHERAYVAAAHAELADAAPFRKGG